MKFEQFAHAVLGVMNNAMLLFLLVSIYAITSYKFRNSNKIHQSILGIIIGLASIFLMMFPYQVKEGIIFDTRSIIFSVSGAFFGFIPTIVGAVIGILYRIYLGGMGLFVGVSTIVISSTIGLIYYKLIEKFKFINHIILYYVTGLVTHTIIFFMFTTMEVSLDYLIDLSLIYLIILPILQVIICIILEQQALRLELLEQNIVKNKLLKSSIDATYRLEIYALNQNYEYIAFNKFHEKQMKQYWNANIKIGDNFLKYIKNETMYNRYKETFEKVFNGSSIVDLLEIEVTPGKYIEESFTPILKDNVVIGVSVFTKDVTQQKRYEEHITRLSYYDAITNLYNRHYFQKVISELDPNKTKITIISLDVNGLKVINDTFGHDMGDKLIIHVARILKENFKENSYIFRMGGDEFTIILIDVDRNHAQRKMEKIIKSFNKDKFMQMTISVSYGISSNENQESIAELLKSSEEEMYKQKLYEFNSHRSEFIKSILKSLHEKNPYAEEHSQRVSIICEEIGKKLGLRLHEINLLRLISQLHDIGKVTIDEAILNKPGKLTDEEWSIIKRHPEIGYRIVSTSPEYQEIAYDILSHHERYDGKGYPQGLKGDEIPLRARIVAIADAYDAMTSNRPYRKALTKDEAIHEIMKNSGTQFDPALVEIFLDVLHDHPEL